MENYLPKTMDFYLPKSMDFSLPFTTGTYPAVFDHFKKFRYERTYQWNSQHQPFRD
jgi:hypothetical protein